MAKDSAEFMIDILDFTANLTFLCMVSSLGLFQVIVVCIWEYSHSF